MKHIIYIAHPSDLTPPSHPQPCKWPAGAPCHTPACMSSPEGHAPPLRRMHLLPPLPGGPFPPTSRRAFVPTFRKVFLTPTRHPKTQNCVTQRALCNYVFRLCAGGYYGFACGFPSGVPCGFPCGFPCVFRAHILRNSVRYPRAPVCLKKFILKIKF